MLKIDRTTRQFSSIREPPSIVQDLWAEYGQTFLVRSISSDRCPDIFSRESALLLAELHPLIVTPKNQCLGSLRTLQVLTPRLKADDIIPVGVATASINSEAIRQFVQADILIGALLYSAPHSSRDIFRLSESLPEDLISKISPALRQSLPERAKFLNVSVGALYKWLKKI